MKMPSRIREPVENPRELRGLAILSMGSQIRRISEKSLNDKEQQQEIAVAMKEDKLVREYGEEYIGYMTFIMQKLL